MPYKTTSLFNHHVHLHESLLADPKLDAWKTPHPKCFNSFKDFLLEYTRLLDCRDMNTRHLDLTQLCELDKTLHLLNLFTGSVSKAAAQRMREKLCNSPHNRPYLVLDVISQLYEDDRATLRRVYGGSS